MYVCMYVCMYVFVCLFVCIFIYVLYITILTLQQSSVIMPGNLIKSGFADQRSLLKELDMS